jgi:bifunctional non-homologous end joining protein LigD
VTYDQSKHYAHGVALLMEKNWPRLVVSKMSKVLRPGKVLVDWSQNDNHKTTIAPYSLRARERPSVSTPITWEELRAFAAKKNPDGLMFEARDLAGRIKRRGDLYAPVATLKQKLPHVKKGIA